MVIRSLNFSVVLGKLSLWCILLIIFFNTIYNLCRGMRLSLPKSIKGVSVTSITAYDISSVCNSVYAHNFPESSIPVSNSSIDNLRVPLDDLKGKLNSKLVSFLKFALRYLSD